MAIYSAVLDACVIVPAALCDTHLRLAEKMLFRPIWSTRILTEAHRAIVRIRPDLDDAGIERRLRTIDEAFPDANVEPPMHVERGLTLPDPDDRHVVATAMRANADAIVTANLRDFPLDYLAGLGLEVVSPDEFLLNQLDMAGAEVVDAVREQAAATRNPPLSVDDVLRALTRVGAGGFADALSRRF